MIMDTEDIRSNGAVCDRREALGNTDQRISVNEIQGASNDGKPVKRTISQAYLFPHPATKKFGRWETVLLAYQTLGVVYGDLGTSPLYVFSSFPSTVSDERDILGILSIIFWTLTLIGLIKYVFIVLHADDHGEGGTFALYSLLCQHMNVGQNAGKQYTRLASDAKLRFFSKQHQGKDVQSKTKQLLEKSKVAQRILIIVVMVGTCMVIGDGALTPAISVLSAVQGIQAKNSNFNQDAVVGVSAVILILLFLLQRFGTSRVSFLFSPIMVCWFISTASIGAYNIGKHYPGVFKAFSPHYIVYFFQRNRKQGWVMLGSSVLCITGAEAMFADLGHFNKRSIQMAFSMLVYPSLIITYSGEAAYLIKHPEHISEAFYKSIPHPVYWPMFIIATLAAIVASQALISATFSIIKQSMALGCFPRVKIVHTSQQYEGQIYSPEVNYVLMVICIAILGGFKGGSEIGNAYGVAVIWVMFITTCLVTLVMLAVWNMNIIYVLPFLIVFGVIEGVYVTAVLNKVPEGGWVPFLIAVIFLTIMLSWNYGRQKKYKYEMERKLSIEGLHSMVNNVGVCRVPGVCFFCSDLIHGLPPIIEHYVKNVSSLHEILIIVTIRFVPVKTVLPEERFLVGKLEPKGVYRCLAQYGYMDVPSMEGYEFLHQVIESIQAHIRSKELLHSSGNLDEGTNDIQLHSYNRSASSNVSVKYSYSSPYEELQELELAKNKGAVFVLGKTTLRTSRNTGVVERFVIEKMYGFLQNNCRSTISTLKVPPAQMLQVGMLYEI
eukprot:Gb_04121 [translate_table: standard]